MDGKEQQKYSAKYIFWTKEGEEIQSLRFEVTCEVNLSLVLKFLANENLLNRNT